MGDAPAVSTNPSVGGFNFDQGYIGTEKDAWVTGLPADLQKAFADLDSAPPEKRAELAEALVKHGLAQFDAAAKEAKLPEKEAALYREALEDSLRGSAGTIFMNRLSAEKMAGLSIEELMFFVMSERVKGLDRQVRTFADDIQNRNNLMEHANNMMSQARNSFAGLDDGESATMSAEMVAFMEQNGIPMPDDTTTGSVGKYDAAKTITDADTALSEISTARGKTDGACDKEDAPDALMTFCARYGIDVPNNGKNMSKSDYNTLEGSIDKLKAEAQVQKDDEAAAATTDGAPAEKVFSAKSMTKDQWESSISSMKGFLEGLNNQSELDMIKYQSVMGKYTSAIEMLSNTMKKLADNKQAIVRNMG
jgi:hypothetical protein